MHTNKLLALLVILFYCCVAQAQTDIYSSSVNGTWTVEASPYLVHVSIQVEDAQVLIIEPGVQVFFDDLCGMNLDGCLKAVGTAQDSIRFTPANESWTGIHIYGTNWDADSTRIEYCVISGSSSGGIYCDTAFKVSIKHCRISDNTSDYGGGIFVYGSTPVITDNLIKENFANGNGGGIYVWENSTPLIARNKIINNHCNDSGGGIGVADCIPLIYENIIQSNTASYVGGGIFLFNSSASIINNMLLNNTGYFGGGVGVWSGCPPCLAGNLICNNTGTYGGGLYSYNGNGISWNNNTVCNNYANSGGGIFLENNIDLCAVNSILWGNQATSCNEVYIGAFCNPSFTNCCIEGGYTYFGGAGLSGYDFNQNTNLSSDNPLFSNPTDSAGASEYCSPEGWMLSANSPCIDAGILTDDLYLFYFDVFGSPRIYGSAIDIGAAERQSGQSETPPDTPNIPETALFNYPNPFNPETTISYTLKENSKITLSIYNVRGELIRTLFSDVAEKGTHSLSWDGKTDSGRDVSSGYYLCCMRTGSQTFSRRMLLLK